MVEIWNSLWHLLLNVLVAINSVVHNPGISIILFTLFIRVLTVPLTMKSLRSSRNMQAIQPRIKEIQKLYGKDKQKQQEETMKLYQAYGVNPAAGCFPMLVQIPIFFGLFSALQFTLQHPTDAAALAPILWNHAWIAEKAANFAVPFLWIPNLAKADPLYILPVLSGIFQFAQNRMSIPYRDPSQPMDGQQKMMNNVMQFMPLYIVFISLSFPSGTVIYWVFSSIFGAVQQYFITGWGSLPDVPGLNFLPRKPLTPPKLPEAKAVDPGGRKGVMAWMMEKAQSAQEEQKASQAAASTEASGASTVRVPTRGRERTRPAKAQRLDAEAVDAGAGHSRGAYGVETPTFAPAQLPRKKRSKR